MEQFNLQKLNSLRSQAGARATFVSYYPCLVNNPGLLVESDSSILTKLNEYQEDLCNVQSVGWIESPSGDEVLPVFLIKYAKEVVEHLQEWMHGDTSWFTLVWEVKKDGRYSMALIPDASRSVTEVDDINLVYWAWSFNSVGSASVDVRKVLRGSGMQKLCFADNKERQVVKIFSFPVRRMSTIPHNDPLRRHAECYIFKNN